MLLTNTADISLGQAGLYALLGYAVVFFGLILLMTVVVIFGKAFTAAQRRADQKAETAWEEAVSAPAAAPAAPGSAGQLKLHNVDPKTAAMLMAIVADKLGRPINELRFLSIKEVTE